MLSIFKLLVQQLTPEHLNIKNNEEKSPLFIIFSTGKKNNHTSTPNDSLCNNTSDIDTDYEGDWDSLSDAQYYLVDMFLRQGLDVNIYVYSASTLQFSLLHICCWKNVDNTDDGNSSNNNNNNNNNNTKGKSKSIIERLISSGAGN